MKHQVAADQAGAICETIWPCIVPRLEQQLRAMNCTRREHKNLGTNLDFLVSLDSHRAGHPVPGGLKPFHLTSRQNGWLFATFSQYGTNIRAAVPVTQF